MVRLLVCCRVVHVILRLLQDGRVHNLRLTWNSFGIRVFRVWAHVHVRICVGCSVSSLLFKRWPSFFAYKGIIIFVFRVVLEKCLRRRALTLVMVSAHITAYVFALVKV